MATHNEPLDETNDKSLKDQGAAESKDEKEEISLEDANKISGGAATSFGTA